MAEVNLLSSSNELQKWKQRSQRSCDVEKWKRRSLNAAGRARSQRKNHPPTHKNAYRSQLHLTDGLHPTRLRGLKHWGTSPARCVTNIWGMAMRNCTNG